MFNSEFFFIMYPSNGSVKQQFTLNILPSNLNFGIFYVVDVSKFSFDITKSWGTYFLPCYMSIPLPGQVTKNNNSAFNFFPVDFCSQLHVILY